MKHKLLPVFYLPPVRWFAEFLSDDAVIALEVSENLPKQTFRTRANIYGANGKLSLIIPVHHNGKRAMRDIEISFAEKWHNLHWKSIKNAYQSSPYFEFYEDRLAEIYTGKEKFLVDFNLKALQIIQQILKTDESFTLNTEYAEKPEAEDLRNSFSAKKETGQTLEQYYQTFSDRMGFLPNLSVLDLICNKGPESLTYIHNIK